MPKIMLNTAIFLFAFCFAASATPPTDIIFTFDTANSIVKADIVHPTENPKEHFIYMIQVSVNGKKLIKQEATEQATADVQKVMYFIPGLKAGDKVSIDADCNKYGDITKEAVAPEAQAAPAAVKKAVKKQKKAGN
jgi:hypothetical protein